MACFYNIRILGLSFLLLTLSESSLAQFTCTTETWPSDASGTFSGYNSHDAITNSGYLMEAVEYHVPDGCECGMLEKWIFVPQNSGDIQFQVWYHLNASTYILKGENYFTVTSSVVGKQIEFLVPERDRINIRNGYLIGWYSTGSGIIGYKDGVEGYSDEARQKPVSDLNPAGEPILDWRSADTTAFENKIYAIGAVTQSNTAPGFTNLPREVMIYKDEAARTYIYQISVGDIDSGDVSSLIVYDTAEDATSFFYFDRTTKTVYTAIANPHPGTYTMTFEVQDQCLNTNTGVLTIKVLNWAPSLTNLPAFATLPEVTSNEVSLYTILFSDRDNTTLNEVASLNIVPNSATTGVADPVEIKYTGLDNSNRTLISKVGASYTYNDQQQYIMDITLTDGTNETDKGYFLLYITKNDPPKFTNLNNGAQANVSYLTTANGDHVFTVSTTDADNDELQFSLTCDPAGCPFEVTSTEGGGVISSTRDFIRTYDTGWDIEITVTDGYTTVGPRTLTVLVQDINDKPRFVNLPLNYGIGVHENTPLGTTIYTISYIDIDTNDNHSIHVTYNPTWAANYFEMNISSGELTTEHNILDYEQLASYTITLTVRVSDDKDYSDDTLIIYIRNVNEAPSFHQSKYTLEPAEEGPTGGSAGDWRPIVIDQDSDVVALGETHSFTWDCGTNTRHFRMARADGAVTYATTFDYDTVNFTTPYDCIVTVKDKAGLSATTTLQISITDLNDNAPVFAKTTDNYIFQTPTLDPGRFVGQVTATDADRDEANSAIYYSWHTYPAALGKDFLLINDFGNIYVNETWTRSLFNYGISYEFVVLAENLSPDHSPRQTATATVTLFLSGTTTTTDIATDRPLEFIEDNRNVAWVTVAVSIGVIVLILLCGFSVMYTVQVKRYRWCIPWCRKRLLGIKDMTEREKLIYYRGLILDGEFDELDDDEESDDDAEESALHPNHDSDDEVMAPPMMWNRLTSKGKANVRGATVRKTSVPQPAFYQEPKPPLKKTSV